MNTKNNKVEVNEVIAGIVSKVRNDREFRQKLRAGDSDTLAQIGVVESSDAGTSPEFKMVTSTQDVTYIQMPFKVVPSDGPVSPEQMARVYGGVGQHVFTPQVAYASPRVSAEQALSQIANSGWGVTTMFACS